MRFKGWIPTSTGNLSFSSIGNAARPRRLLSSFREIHDAQYFVVVQRRRTTDALFGFIGDYYNKLIGRDGWFTFFVFGEIENHDGDDLHGSARLVCCVLPDLEKQRALTITENLRNHLSNPDDYQYGLNRAKERSATLTAECGLAPVFGKLCRSGECTLALPEDMIVDGREVLIAQTYYFLRDISHIHQHHEANSDTILSIYPERDNVGREWTDRVLFALHRWIIQQKRRKDHLGSIRSIGILAYAEVFRDNFRSNGSRPSHDRFAANHLKQSMGASVSEHSAIENSSRNPVALGTIIVSALLLCISILFNIKTDAVEKSSSADAYLYLKLQYFINVHPLFSMSIALLFTLSLGLAFIYHRLFSTAISDFIRLSLSFGAVLSKILRFLFGGFLIISALMLLIFTVTS